MGKMIIYIGVSLIGLGIIIHYFGDYFKWFGNLPGDIRINNKNFTIFIPFTSMLLISILLTFVMTILKRLLK